MNLRSELWIQRTRLICQAAHTAGLFLITKIPAQSLLDDIERRDAWCFSQGIGPQTPIGSQLHIFQPGEHVCQVKDEGRAILLIAVAPCGARGEQ